MIKVKKLPLGIRLVTEKLPEFQAASIGIFVGAGSAYENEHNAGISHFIEHMFFKGTKNRGYREIAEDMDRLGAQYNAFTSKEYTCFHAKAMKNVFPNCCEILFDMMTNSLFDSNEMKKELGVILEEMRMVEDTPDDIIIDYLSESVLKGSDLANSIIGTRKSLKSITRDDILQYIKTQYTKDNIVIAVAGNFDEKLLIKQIESSFNKFKAKKNIKRSTVIDTKPKYISKTKDINQSHLAFGISTVSLNDKNYFAQAIVNDVLGGSMSSRLFQNIREGKGLAYSIYSSPLASTYNGMFFIYAAVSLGKEGEAIKGIAEELSKISLSEEELENVKQRLKASYIFGLERLDNRMLRLGKNQLLLGKNLTEEQTLKKIDSINMKQIKEYCESISDINKYSVVCISKNKVDIKKLIKN